LLLLATLPFAFWPWGIDPNLNLQALLLAVFLLLSAAGAVRGGDSEGAARVLPAALLWPAFLLLAAVPTAWAVNRAESVVTWLNLFQAGGVLWAAIRLFRRPGAAMQVSSLVAGVALVLSTVTIFQFIQKGIQHPSGRILYEVSATLGHKNLLSSFLMLTLPFSLFAAIAGEGRRRTAGGIAAASALSLILLLQTRSVWVGLGASGLWAVLLVAFSRKAAPGKERLKKPGLRRFMPWAAALTVFLAALAFAVRDGGLSGLAARAESVLSVKENDWRLRLWRKSGALIADHPWGVGLGNWKVHLPAYGMDELGIDWEKDESRRFGLQVTRPHNDWLWVLSETGPAGMAAYLAFFLVLLAGSIRSHRLAGDSKERLFSLLASAGLVGYLADSTFSFPMERPGHLAYMMTLSGALLGIQSRWQTRTRPLPRAAGKAAAWVLLAFAAFALLVWVERLRAEYRVRTLLEARALEDWPKVVELADRAESWFYPLDPSNNPVSFYRGTARFLLGQTREACADFAMARSLHPQHLHILNNLGTCSALEGRTEEAFAFYERALRISSRFDGALLNMVAMHYQMGNYDRAWELLVTIDNDHHNPEVGRFFDILEPLLNRKRP
jgi:O-antigen ligase